MCVGLLLRLYWPSVLKEYFRFYFYLSLLYCLPFHATLIFLLEKGNSECLINVIFAIMLLVLLTDWLVFVTLTGIGILLAIIVYYSLFDNYKIAENDSIYLLAYTCFFSTIIGITFVRRRQQYLELLLNNQQKLSELYSSTSDRLVDALNYQEKIAHSLGKDGLKILEQAQNITNNLCKKMMLGSSEIFTNAHNKLNSITKYLEEIANHAKDYVKLKVENIDLNLLLKDIVDQTANSIYSPFITPFNNTHYKTIECDINLIKKTLVDTINHVKEYSFMTNDIQIQVDSTELWYRLGSIKDYTKKIPAISRYSRPN